MIRQRYRTTESLFPTPHETAMILAAEDMFINTTDSTNSRYYNCDMALFLTWADAAADYLSFQEEYEKYRNEMPWPAVPFKVQASQ